MAAASSAPEQPAPFETAQRCPVNQDFLVSRHEAWQAASGTNDGDLIGFGLLRTQSDHVVCEDCKGKIAHHETKEEKQKRKERGKFFFVLFFVLLLFATRVWRLLPSFPSPLSCAPALSLHMAECMSELIGSCLHALGHWRLASLS